MTQFLSTTSAVADDHSTTELATQTYPQDRRSPRSPLRVSIDVVLEGDPPLVITAQSRVMSRSGATLILNCNVDQFARFALGQTISLRPTFSASLEATINALWTEPAEPASTDEAPPHFLMGVCIGDGSWINS